MEGSIDGGIEQSIVYAYAENRNVPVVPVDWFDDVFIEELTQDNSQEIPNLEHPAVKLSKL